MTMTWTRIEIDAYWLIFLTSFLAVAMWESHWPKRSLSTAVTRRWSRHGIMLLASTVIPTLLFRTSPILVALAVAHSRFGLLNRPWQPFVVRFVAAVLVLDLVRYGVHRFHHALPLLWRVHHVHHSDPDIDLSTGARAHPLETILMQGANLAAVAILAAPPAAVLVIELFSSAQSFFSHANGSLPGWIEKPARRIFVTPDMHRIHHSEEILEQSRNFGDIFPWWDHLFRTYLEAPAAGQERMVVGLKGFQNDESLNVSFMLLHPFRLQPDEAGAQEAPVTRAERLQPENIIGEQGKKLMAS
jgi:sterol desaturase/sphingolipid hydroxylase (fatty acid hydroxylase superfamily)